MLELMTLVETGTRALIGAVFGTTSDGETAYARRLLHHLGPDMLVLWDRGFDANAFLAAVATTGAQFVGRLRANRRTPILARLADGSYLSVLGTVPVRVVEARITVTCDNGTSFNGSYRLVTTLTDARRYPADALVGLYHQRWDHESAYFALRHTILRGRVLRSGDPIGVEQEMWAWTRGLLNRCFRGTRPRKSPESTFPPTTEHSSISSAPESSGQNSASRPRGRCPTDPSASEPSPVWSTDSPAIPGPRSSRCGRTPSISAHTPSTPSPTACCAGRATTTETTASGSPKGTTRTAGPSWCGCGARSPAAGTATTWAWPGFSCWRSRATTPP
ncbi:transposase [Kitasatospora azatica]|uniref:transposase n=1 Tax=Kitasatospora azatica TaxID=58347 RepID=UPI002D219C87|nr:transposase [Kitasatospora azatica]